MQLAIEAQWEFKQELDNRHTFCQVDARLKDYKFGLALYKKNYWNKYQQNHCLKKAYEARKLDHKHIKDEAYKMIGALEMMRKELAEVKDSYRESLQLLKDRIEKLEVAKKDLQHKQTIL